MQRPPATLAWIVIGVSSVWISGAASTSLFICSTIGVSNSAQRSAERHSTLRDRDSPSSAYFCSSR